MDAKVVIRKYCIYCVGGIKKDVRTCGVKDCAFYRFRTGRKVKFERENSQIRVLAIKQYCEECQGKVGKLTQDVIQAVVKCCSKICPLVDYRPVYQH